MVIIPIPKGIPDKIGTIQCTLLQDDHANLQIIISSNIYFEFCDEVHETHQNKLIGTITPPIMAAYSLYSGAGFPFAAILALAYSVLSNKPKMSIPQINPGNKPRKASPVLFSSKPYTVAKTYE